MTMYRIAYYYALIRREHRSSAAGNQTLTELSRVIKKSRKNRLFFIETSNYRDNAPEGDIIVISPKADPLRFLSL